MAISDYPSASRFTQFLEDRSTARIITLIVIPVLLIAALLLPPISVVERIQDAGKVRVSTAGGVVSDPDGTQVTFLPGTVAQSFRAQMQSVPRPSFLQGSGGQETAAAAKAIPPHLVAKSPYYGLSVSGKGATQSNWLIPIPNDSEPYQTLDVYTWDATTKTWQWLPHSLIVDDEMIEARVPYVPTSAMIMQTNPLPAVVSADAKVASSLPTESQGALGEVHPTGLYLGGNGAIEGAIDANFARLGKSFGVVPVVRNHEGPVVRTDLLANMLTDPAQRNGHVEALVNIAVTNLYNGLDIDYRGLDPALRPDFTQFVSLLGQKLHAQNKRLAVRVEAPVQVAEDRWETGAYDWVSIGRVADVVKVPGPVNPQAYIAGGQIDSLLAFATGQVNRYKLELSLAGQSVEQSGNYLLLKSYNDALQPLVGRIEVAQPVVQPGGNIDLALVSTHANSGLVFDPNIGTYVYRYKDDQGNARTVWLENAASLSHKLKLISRYNIRGFTVENLPADGMDKDLWPLIRNFQQGKADPINNSFMVEWTIRSSSGEVLREMRALNAGATNLKAPQQPGELQIQAALVDRGQVFSTRNAVGAVATYTPTPSPTPIYTPTPEPSATPSVAQFLVSSDTLNVRAGPDAAYPKVAELKRGDRKEITGKNEAGSWYQFKLEDGSGWVSAQLVSVGGSLAALKVVKVDALPTAEPKPTAEPAATQAAAPAAVRLPTTSTGFGYGMQVDPWGGHISAVKGAGMNWVKFQVPWTALRRQQRRQRLQRRSGEPGACQWAQRSRQHREVPGVGPQSWIYAGRGSAPEPTGLCRLRRRLRRPLLWQGAGDRGVERAEHGLRVGLRDRSIPAAT